MNKKETIKLSEYVGGKKGEYDQDTLQASMKF